MATIITRNFAAGSAKALALVNEEFVRKLKFGDNWSKIRLGILCAIKPLSTDYATSNIPPIDFCFGLCKGANAIADTIGLSRHTQTTPTEWVGARLSGDGSAPQNATGFTYNAGSGNPYYSTVFSGVVARNSTANVRQASASTNPIIPVAESGTNRRAILLIELERGAPNYTLRTYTPTSAMNSVDFTPGSLSLALDQVTFNQSISVQGNTLNKSSDNSFAYSPGSNPLDTLSLYWSSALFQLEVYAIGARKV
jgi:hypothetical protein